ncbi:uncharacterized protein PAC_13097 [Phialocephala subalpina]|uniref:BTB domain-containing protein n=1 Tax=Phialocephala subalpina TaxID=576137 RepID=A0A1L7XDT2_9HELO|nr:uncharacterized protein PAC_13097 [Phialocephala subalpina]
MEIGENEHHQGDIAPGGDVIFLISPEKKRLRVYSLIIKHTSKVFAILFGPQFNEGQNLLNANAQTVEILLPEDDPEAMAVICNVIHGQNDAIIEPLNPTQILKISIAADKRDSITSLPWAIKELIEDGKCFENLTWALMMHHKGSYLKPSEEPYIETVEAMRIRILLEESRANIRTELLEGLMPLSTRVGPRREYGWVTKHCLNFTESLPWLHSRLMERQHPRGKLWTPLRSSIICLSLLKFLNFLPV